MHCIEWLPLRKVSVGSVCEKEMPMSALWRAAEEEGGGDWTASQLNGFNFCLQMHLPLLLTPRPRLRPATNYAWTFRHLNALQALFRFQFDSEFECEFSEIKDIDLFSDWIWTTQQTCRVPKKIQIYFWGIAFMFLPACLPTLLFEVLFLCIL